MHNKGFNYRILVVDDEPSILEVAGIMLREQGYEVRTAADGFAALAELQRALPDVVISDLRMPNMSGFELLSVVRRRFPHVAVIAISGEFDGTMPEGVIADAFFSKGSYRPEQLFKRIAELIQTSPIRPQVQKPDRAPVWLPRNEAGYLVVTCTNCLRSFSIPDQQTTADFHETPCLFYQTRVRFLANKQKIKQKSKAC